MIATSQLSSKNYLLSSRQLLYKKLNLMNKILLSIMSLILFLGCSQKVGPTYKPASVGPKKEGTVMIKPHAKGEKPVMTAASVPAKSTTKMNMQTPEITELIWDEWGVPHIYAKNNQDLFYSFGWAQMHSHANTILKLYGTSRGRAAEYWGADHLENDMMVHALGFDELGPQWYDQLSSEFQNYLDEFARGMNDYIVSNPDAVSDKYKVVLPITNHDAMRHALFVLYTRFVGGNNLSASSRWEERGSNTFAVGPSRSASGNAMLVMNPHLPWFDEWLFYEGHFNAPGINMYGATLVGLPTLGIAFNENLGWSHTNNTIDNADLYELTLQDDGYVVDGEVRPFDARQVVLKIKQEDGTMREQTVPLLSSKDHGAIIKRGEKKALAIKMPGFDRPHGIVQWWRMASAKSLSEFKTSLKEVQIPFFNIMYADKEGNIFYMFNGQVPDRKVGGWDYWKGVVDGSKSENLWTDVHSYEELPKTENPASGYLQNANDPPWTSTFPMVLSPDDYPPYMSPVVMGFRPQRAAQMMDEDASITFEELVEYKKSTRVGMADRILDDLFTAIDKYGGADAKAAKKVLMAWDREANADSKGMALFYPWAHAIHLRSPKTYTEKWQLDKARSTPDGLADPKGVVEKLEEIVGQFRAGGVPLDVAWGDVYRIKYGDRNLPANGSDGSVGMFRVAWSDGLQEDGKYYVSGGDSWQSIIEFGDKVRAKVLLSYGNSTQKDSPHYGDQLELFSKKEMRDCYFYREDVEQHIAKRIVMKNGTYNKDSALSRY